MGREKRKKKYGRGKKITCHYCGQKRSMKQSTMIDNGKWICKGCKSKKVSGGAVMIVTRNKTPIIVSPTGNGKAMTEEELPKKIRKAISRIRCGMKDGKLTAEVKMSKPTLVVGRCSYCGSAILDMRGYKKCMGCGAFSK